MMSEDQGRFYELATSTLRYHHFSPQSIYVTGLTSSSTAIESRKFRIPSDLRRQPGYRPVSSKVGDHLRILLGAVVNITF